MRLYRLYTEDKPNLDRLASSYFEGFTIFRSEGYWKGEKENSVCIEILTSDHESVLSLVRNIKEANHQEAVLLIVLDCTSELI